jgi:hypothetical protein
VNLQSFSEFVLEGLENFNGSNQDDVEIEHNTTNLYYQSYVRKYFEACGGINIPMDAGAEYCGIIHLYIPETYKFYG